MSKKFILLIVFLVFLAFGGYFLYTKLFLSEMTVGLGPVKNLETTFETGFFSSQKFLGLKDHLAAPLVAGERGKINPFMKF